MKKNTLFNYLIFCMLLVSVAWGQDNIVTRLTATLDDESLVAENGLHFGDDRQFGPRITPYGDCFDIINGYAFLSWYQGGMDDRSLMLSRKNLNEPNSDWVTIEFPHEHFGFRGDRSLGDSHNTIAVGISTTDNRVHLIYDFHSYTTSDTPDAFFNYSVSEAEGAFVPDAEFNLSLFENENTTNAKLNYLKQGENYQLLTYPEIHRTPDGNLVVTYRYGGAGTGDRMLAYYDSTNGWTDNWKISEGRFSSPRYSMYGYSKFQFGKYYFGFAIRSYQDNTYNLNEGLYFLEADATPTGPSTTWSNAYGDPISTPFRNTVEDLKIGMPQDFSNEAVPRTPSNPAFVVTESGAVHLLARGGSTDVHYYRGPGETEFTASASSSTPYLDIRGDMFSYLDHVFVIQLIGSKLTIKTTKEGTDNWTTIYEEDAEDLRYKYFEALTDGDKLYVYLMEQGSSQSLPLYFKEFTLSEELINLDEIPNFTIEAENFSSKDGYALVAVNDNASNGRYIGEFREGSTLTYNFNLNNFSGTTPGTFDFKIVASNQDSDDSTMDVTVNGEVYTNVPITRTNDWNVFERSTLENIQLVDGQNSITIKQNLGTSARPDLLELYQRSTLSSDRFERNEVVIYPNPTRGLINIETNLSSPNYQVISIQGRVMEEGKLNSKVLNLSSYAKGVYLLQLSTGSERLVKKIIIN